MRHQNTRADKCDLSFKDDLRKLSETLNQCNQYFAMSFIMGTSPTLSLDQFIHEFSINNEEPRNKYLF